METIFSNIWKHPKTSVSGVLICIVTITGVLLQQGITLGTAGTGTVVALIGALATALLGLLAKDPGSATVPAVKSATLGVLMLCFLLVGSLFQTGCSGVTVAQDIVNWTPALQSAVATVDTTVSLLAPADAPIFTAATAGFDTASNLLVTQAKAYLANPSATILGQIQTQIVTFQQQVNVSLLQAGKIVDPASQKHALAAIQAVAVVVSAMLSLVQSVSSKTALAAMASRSTIKLAMVIPLLNRDQAAELLAAHYREPRVIARWQVAQAEQYEALAGF